MLKQVNSRTDRKDQAVDGTGDPVAGTNHSQYSRYLGQERTAAVKHTVDIADEGLIAVSVIDRSFHSVFRQALCQIGRLVLIQTLGDQSRCVGNQTHGLVVRIAAGIADQIDRGG
ncbi:MAG: hypothetical protein IJ719_16610 [Clostridia bacterium]|nr:hypothetical protein [Clostridia bacterium]